MKLASSVFKNNENIPPRYTCDGQDFSPPLEISGVPANTRSLVLIMDDPDAPAGFWTHWTVWNIDPATIEIKEDSVPAGAVAGITTAGTGGYHGPCPPGGTHRYVFHLSALDCRLDLPDKTHVSELKAAMTGHILETTEVIGKYRR